MFRLFKTLGLVLFVPGRLFGEEEVYSQDLYMTVALALLSLTVISL